jgi:hypothetical protein
MGICPDIASIESQWSFWPFFACSRSCSPSSLKETEIEVPRKLAHFVAWICMGDAS